jgi:hypothetical protein
MIIYDARQQSLPWWFPLLGVTLAILISLVSLAFYVARHASQVQRGKSIIMLMFGLVLGLVWAFLVVPAVSEDFTLCQRSLQTHAYSVVEGRIEDFRPSTNISGHPPEHFTVQGVTFEYKDNPWFCGFNQTSGNGGPIHSNMVVRVSYLPYALNKIVRLELRP